MNSTTGQVGNNLVTVPPSMKKHKIGFPFDDPQLEHVQQLDTLGGGETSEQSPELQDKLGRRQNRLPLNKRRFAFGWELPTSD